MAAKQSVTLSEYTPSSDLDQQKLLVEICYGITWVVDRKARGKEKRE